MGRGELTIFDMLAGHHPLFLPHRPAETRLADKSGQSIGHGHVPDDDDYYYMLEVYDPTVFETAPEK